MPDHLTNCDAIGSRSPVSASESWFEFNRIQHPRQRAFLEAFSRCGNVKRAAAGAGIERTTHYKWLERDEDYCQYFAQAQEMAADALQDHAIQLAVNGQRRCRFDAKGKHLIDPRTGEPYYETEYDTKLIMTLLAALRPAVYGPLSNLRHGVDD